MIIQLLCEDETVLVEKTLVLTIPRERKAFHAAIEREANLMLSTSQEHTKVIFMIARQTGAAFGQTFVRKGVNSWFLVEIAEPKQAMITARRYAKEFGYKAV